MFCPECKAEYRVGFTTCSDCDVELVDALVEPVPPPEAEPRPERVDAESKEFVNLQNPVEIERFLHMFQAEFAVSVLDGSGIKAYIDQEFTGNIAPYFMLMSGGIRLLVAGQDRERALEVLQSSEELSQNELADQGNDL